MPVIAMVLEGFYAGLHREIFDTGRDPLILVRGSEIADVCPRSYRSGVRRRMKVSEGRFRLPGALVRELDPDNYGPDVEMLATACADISPGVEAVSPDCVFADIGDEDGLDFVRRLVKRLPRGVGYGVRVGVGRGKFTADLALNRAMRESANPRYIGGWMYSMYSIATERGDEGVAGLSPSLSGLIPRSILSDLERLGLSTFGDIADMPTEILDDRFGFEWARRIAAWSRGEDITVVSPNYPPPRKMRRRDVEDWRYEAVKKGSMGDLERMSRELESDGLAAGEMVLYLLERVGGWKRRGRIFPGPRTNRVFLESALNYLWSDIECTDPLEYRLELRDLNPGKLSQRSLWDGRDVAREDLEDLITDLSRKHRGRVTFWGEEMKVSRRERVLEFWDPLRMG